MVANNLAQAAPALRRKVLRSLLMPIISFCLRHAFRFQQVNELVKECFVLAAEQSLRGSDSKVNASQVAIYTGVDRREVARLLDRSEQDPKPDEISVLQKLLGLWQNAAQYQDESGKPKALRIKGKGNEFTALVNSVTTEFKPGTVLAELERRNMIERLDRKVQLTQKRNPIVKDTERGFSSLELDLNDLVLSVEQNLLAEQELGNAHYRTEYNNIYVDDIPIIRRWLIEQSKRNHAEYRRFLSKFDQDISPEEGREAGAKVVISSFSITEAPEL